MAARVDEMLLDWFQVQVVGRPGRMSVEGAVAIVVSVLVERRVVEVGEVVPVTSMVLLPLEVVVVVVEAWTVVDEVVAVYIIVATVLKVVVTGALERLASKGMVLPAADGGAAVPVVGVAVSVGVAGGAVPGVEVAVAVADCEDRLLAMPLAHGILSCGL